MTTVGFVLNLHRPEAGALARELIAQLHSQGMRAVVAGTDAAKVGLDEWAVPDDELGATCDLAVSLGGDGTILRTADLVARNGVPILGVNIGNLGYLTTVLPEHASEALQRALAGDSGIEERMTLDVEVRLSGQAEPAATYLALNEAVLEKSSAGNTVRLGVAFNDVPFIDYSADGLIIATPTGSTAYAFSARGPVVSPRLAALLVVPVSPHMLFDRCLVLSAQETVRCEVHGGRPATLFIDGRDAGELPVGAVVLCRAGAHPARFITFAAQNFHMILKKKFELADPEPMR